MVGVADPLDAMIGRCDDVVEGVADEVASSTPLRLDHSGSTGLSTQRLDRVAVGA
jgi:hypothetical protein